MKQELLVLATATPAVFKNMHYPHFMHSGDMLPVPKLVYQPVDPPDIRHFRFRVHAERSVQLSGRRGMSLAKTRLHLGRP